MKIVLHLCADIGSDSYYYNIDDEYEVIRVGKDIGVENVFSSYGVTHLPNMNVETSKIVGIIANPPCTEFSTARADGKARENEIGYEIVNHCVRIISEIKPDWWVIENPARGTLKNYLGAPKYTYEPWHYGSPWTKQTALWGNFIIPPKVFTKWEDVPKNENLYVRPRRPKASLTFLHKSSIYLIGEFKPFINLVESDMSFRSLCSQKFAKAFWELNK